MIDLDIIIVQRWLEDQLNFKKLDNNTRSLDEWFFSLDKR